MNSIPNNNQSKQISKRQQALHYAGMALIGVGFLVFISVFVSSIATFGNFDNVEERISDFAMTAFAGILMMIAGGVLMNLGAKGLAGAGVLLDPQQARRDMEPWSRMKGGMVQDAVSEIDAVNDLQENLKGARASVIKIRCRECQTLNNEGAKYCNQCGAAL